MKLLLSKIEIIRNNPMSANNGSTAKRPESQLSIVLLIKQFPDKFIEEYSLFIIDGLGHLATHFDLYFKGRYSYGDRFRVVFRVLAKLT